MGYDDIGLYRPGKICGCLRVEVVSKWEHDRECSLTGARARACTKAVSVTQTRWLSITRRATCTIQNYVEHSPAVEHLF